jgi:hypothetical protein
MTPKLFRWQILFLILNLLLIPRLTSAQSLVAGNEWELDKNEILKDFFQHPTLGFVGLSLVYNYPVHIEMGCGPSQVNMWTWDSKLNLISKKEFPIKFSDNDIVVMYGRSSSGWYFGWDKLVGGQFNVRRKTELSVLKLTFEGKVEQSQAFPINVAQDVKGFETLEAVYYSGPILSRFSFQMLSYNRKYILLCDEFQPGTLNYTVLDSAFKQVAEGNLPLDNLKLANNEYFINTVGIDDQGSLHCFDTKKSENKTYPLNYRILPLNGAPQKYAIANQSGDLHAWFTFTHGAERRYVIQHQEKKSPKVKEPPIPNLYTYAVRNGVMTQISGPLAADMPRINFPKWLPEFRGDEQKRTVILVPKANGSNGMIDAYDIGALWIKDGELKGTQVIKRRIKSYPWEMSSEMSFVKNGENWLLYESREEKEAIAMPGLPPIHLYIEPISTKGEAIKIVATTDLGLNIGLGVEFPDARIVIPAVHKGKLKLYTLKL